MRCLAEARKQLRMYKGVEGGGLKDKESGLDLRNVQERMNRVDYSGKGKHNEHMGDIFE